MLSPLTLVSALLGLTGLLGMLLSKNIIRILISIEILLNGIILLIVCNRPESKETPIFALFLLVFTVILSVIALAILYKINAKKMSIQTETLTKLKD